DFVEVLGQRFAGLECGIDHHVEKGGTRHGLLLANSGGALTPVPLSHLGCVRPGSRRADGPAAGSKCGGLIAPEMREVQGSCGWAGSGVASPALAGALASGTSAGASASPLVVSTTWLGAFSGSSGVGRNG